MPAPKRSPIEKVSIKSGGGKLTHKDPWKGLKERDKKAKEKIRKRGF